MNDHFRRTGNLIAWRIRRRLASYREWKPVSNKVANGILNHVRELATALRVIREMERL